MSPKVLKANETAKVAATISPVTMPVITQQELATYHQLSQEAEVARKKVREYEKSCEAYLSLVTGLKKKDYLKLSPNQFNEVLQARFDKEFKLEPGHLDFAIDTKSERGIVAWKEEFIKVASEAQAAVLKAKAPKSYSHRFLVSMSGPI